MKCCTVHGECTWISAPYKESEQRQAAKLSLLLNTSHYQRVVTRAKAFLPFLAVARESLATSNGVHIYIHTYTRHPVNLKGLLSRREPRLVGGSVREGARRKSAPHGAVPRRFEQGEAWRSSRSNSLCQFSAPGGGAGLATKLHRVHPESVSSWKYRCYGSNRQSSVWNISRAKMSPWRGTLLL